MTALDRPNRMIGPNDFIYVICHRLLTQFSCLIISASSWIRETLLKAQIRSTGEVAPRWIMPLEPLSWPHGRLDIWWPIVKYTCTREFSLKSRLLWASFHSLSPLWVRKDIKSASGPYCRQCKVLLNASFFPQPFIFWSKMCLEVPKHFDAAHYTSRHHKKNCVKIMDWAKGRQGKKRDPMLI